MLKFRSIPLAASALFAAAAALAQVQGVTKDEIILGTHHDLSGPAVSIGKFTRNGLQMRVDEINETGGINGRKIRLVVEDSAFDPRRAVSAAQKLVNQDGIFAMVGALGTAQNAAAMPVVTRKNVLHLFPIAGGREMYEPTHPLVYASVAATFMEFEGVVPKLVKDTKASKVCVMHLDDESGLDAVRGTEAGLKTIGMVIASRASYKRTDTDFSSQLQRLAADKCELVVLGSTIRDAVGILSTSRRMGFSPAFVGTQATYSDLIPRLGGAAVEGYYASMRTQHPYPDDSPQQVRHWINKYRTKFGEDPNGFAIMGYAAMEAFNQGAIKAGRDLNNQSFTRAMNSLVIPPDMFGNPEFSWSATKRLGSSAFRLSQIQNGRWKVVKDYADFK